MKNILITTALVALTATSAFAGECGTSHSITKAEILAAQKAWGDGIVRIGAAADHKKAAMEHIDALYAYDLGPVLFKPTKASVVQFRDDKDEALSYFVGGKEPEDKGFALAPYTKVRFENHAMTMDCDSALAMGNYYFTNTQGQEIKVEYSFGYVEDKNGQLKINLHHSSLPYSPE
jgi:hypothetical protein